MKFKEISKGKKALMFIGILMIASVTAYYAFQYTGVTTYAVRGGSGDLLEVVIPLTALQDFDTTLITELDTLFQIDNTGGVGVPMMYNIEVTHTNVNGLCPDFETDVNVWAENFAGNLTDGVPFQMNGGQNAFHLKASVNPEVADRICPQDIDVILTFSEI